MHESPALDALVRQYVDAHIERIQLHDDGTRRLWSGYPVNLEYAAVSSTVRQMAPSAFSSSLVEDYVDTMLTSALSKPEAIDDLVHELAELLQRPVRTHLYAPLDAINTTEDRLEIGAIALIRMTDEAFERLVVEPFALILRHNPHYDEATAQGFIESHRSRLAPFRGRTCVEVTTDVDLRSTFDSAVEVVSSVCDFLQVCLASLVSLRNTNPVRWSNQVAHSSELAFAVMDSPERRTNSQAIVVGGPPMTLNSHSMETLQRNGLLTLGRSLGSTPANEFDTLLRRAIRWFARGEREKFTDDARLAYVTSVELFFSDSGSGSATHRFCKGFAFGLSERPEDISRLARFALHVYSGRSDTSHAGTFDFSRHDGTDSFRASVLEFLARMAQHPFTSKEHIRQWVLDREAMLDDHQRAQLEDAIQRRPFEQDVALRSAAEALLEHGDILSSSEPERLRYVFARLIVDALKDRRFMLQLRPIASELCDAVRGTDDPDERVSRARSVMGHLPWVEGALSERLRSDFT